MSLRARLARDLLHVGFVLLQLSVRVGRCLFEWRLRRGLLLLGLSGPQLLLARWRKLLKSTPVAPIVVCSSA
jgi:hypothetical protein